MRILMVTPYPPARDGLAQYAVQEVKRLRAAEVFPGYSSRLPDDGPSKQVQGITDEQHQKLGDFVSSGRGLAVFLALITFPIWFDLAGGKTAQLPDIKLPPNQTACVAPTEYMRSIGRGRY